MNPSVEGSGVEAMRKLQAVPCAALLLFIMVTQAQAQSLMTHHTRPAVTSGQAKFLNRLPETQTLRIDIVLPMHDQAGLDELLQELYDPASPAYRHFLTVPEFTSRFGPTQEEYEAVIGLAKSYGFTVLGGSRDAMDVQLEGSVTSIELAFNVSMGAYQHPTEGRTFYAPDREPTVALPFGVWHISGLDNYSIPHPASLHRNSTANPNATTGSGPSASFLGSDMRAAYYGGSALTGAGQNIGLLEYYGLDIADVNTYYTNAKQTRSAAVTGISTDGTSLSCTYPSCDDTEQILDITQALGMAPAVSAVYVYVGSSDTAIFSAMTTDNPLPLQLSSSWTWTPADPSTDDPFFKKMATLGQSFFQAAGDSGKWKSSTFPSDDANVICVGGTDLVTSGAGGAWSSETAWVDGGGGISPDKLPIGSYQQLSGVITSQNGGSTVYRNGPDVSANSNFTYYVCADQQACTANLYGGTSFAAPLWAGYIALANQQAKANGASAVGFLNPIIYPLALTSAYSTDFHDIVSGSNGYSAISGYNLATGWGSMNGPALINALSGPPTPNFSISASPNSISVVQGKTGTSTVTTTALNGFSSAINLMGPTSPPAGVTVAFGTNPIASSGSSVVSFIVGSTATPGTYPISITGTDVNTGKIINSTTVSLTVTAPNFTIGASSGTVGVTRGSSSTTTITTTAPTGFNSAITLSATGMGSGVSASFSPNPIAAPGSGTSTLKFTATSRATTGTRTITITGTGGGKTNTTRISLTVAR